MIKDYNMFCEEWKGIEMNVHLVKWGQVGFCMQTCSFSAARMGGGGGRRMQSIWGTLALSDRAFSAEGIDLSSAAGERESGAGLRGRGRERERGRGRGRRRREGGPRRGQGCRGSAGSRGRRRLRFAAGGGGGGPGGGGSAGQLPGRGREGLRAGAALPALPGCGGGDEGSACGRGRPVRPKEGGPRPGGWLPLHGQVWWAWRRRSRRSSLLGPWAQADL